MVDVFKCDPKNIYVSIGPSLCQDCFEVDFDVEQRFITANKAYEAYTTRNAAKAYIDLRKIIQVQLSEEKIDKNHIGSSTLCTKCNPSLFYSHRNMGAKRGVMACAIILKD